MSAHTGRSIEVRRSGGLADRTVDMTASTDTQMKRIRRQRLGLRVSNEPYYRIIEQSDRRLVLQSPPDANARAGKNFMLAGMVIGSLTPLLIIAIFLGGTQSVGDVLFGALLSWPFAAIGIMIWTGGRALASTVNTIAIDADKQTVVYMQANKVGRQRSQTLQFDQIARLRLRPRWFKPPNPLRGRMRVVSLEMITDEDFTWLVDNAIDAADLEPVATGMAGLLGVPLDRSEQNADL